MPSASEIVDRFSASAFSSQSFGANGMNIVVDLLASRLESVFLWR